MRRLAHLLAACLIGWLLTGSLATWGEPAFPSGPEGSSNKYPFQVIHERISTGHLIIGKNDGPAPVSLRMSLEEGSQVDIDQALPLYRVVPAQSSLILARARPKAGEAQYRFRLQSTWSVGDFTARHASTAPYRLPYPDDQSFRISQAPYGGPISTHTTPDSQFAVDIPMPEGTPIVAAREGVVIRTEESKTETGQRPELLTQANSVRILHEDGTTALYAHLTYQGVRVKPGQVVKAGEVIGLAGATGFASGPHLHFAVQSLQKTDQGFSTVSLPFNFYVGSPGVSFPPTFGLMIRADYRNPGRIPLLTGPAIPNTLRILVPNQPSNTPSTKPTTP